MVSRHSRRKPEHRSAQVDIANQLTSASRRADALLLTAFLSSGIAALGLELIWMRILGLAFGSESFGMLGVLAGFFAGLALGAMVLHNVILRSRRPVLIYAAAEGIIAVYALAGPYFMLRLTDGVPRFIGPLVGDNRSLAALSLNLLIAMLVLLPATFCMGATTASVIEAWRRRRTRAANENTVARLYAINTLGAALGIALTTYLLLPWLGVRAASAILGGFSLVATTLACLWERTQTPVPIDERPVPARLPMPAYSRPLVYSLLFVTGLAGIGLETIGTHVLAQIFENTVHTFANILGVFLLGTAAGAWLYANRSVRRFLGDRDRATSLLLYGLAIAGVAAALILARSATILSALAPPESSYATRVIGEVFLSMLVFLPTTLLMGATFSHLLGHFTYDGAGYASASNTLGASLAPFLFGLILIPTAGYGIAFYTAVAMYLLLFIAAGLRRSQSARWLVAGVLLASMAAVLAYSPLVLIQFPPGARLLEQRLGIQGVVSVTETSSARILQVDQRYLMGGSLGFVTQRMGHLAMLLAPAPRQVLYLGVGTGITAGAALDYPVERVTAVELLPEVMDMLPWFDKFNGDLQHDPRVALHASDARRFIRATPDLYDVIVADLYHPNRDGTGALYTIEHYTGIRSRLGPGGIFVQWLPLYQLRPHDLQTIIRTFLAVFPNAHSLLGNYSGSARFALIGGAPEYAGLDMPRAAALLAKRTGPGQVFDGVPDLLASYMLDADGLRRYSGSGPVNTDVNQRITFDAARGVRIEDGAGPDRSLATLLPYRRLFPDTFIRTAGPEGLIALREGIRPYSGALAHYLAAEIARDQPGSSPALVFPEYLKAYQLDSRFTLAAGKLLELGLRQPATEKDIVQQLWQAHPGQPEFNGLHQMLEGVEAPDQVGAIVSRFLQTGGN